jgi:hypothetical protein
MTPGLEKHGGLQIRREYEEQDEKRFDPLSLALCSASSVPLSRRGRGGWVVLQFVTLMYSNGSFSGRRRIWSSTM